MPKKYDDPFAKEYLWLFVSLHSHLFGLQSINARRTLPDSLDQAIFPQISHYGFAQGIDYFVDGFGVNDFR